MNNLQHLLIFACLFLLVLTPLSAKALPPASPAGGNYLALDGVDDYAVLDFKTFGILLPEGTGNFTIEAWIYPTTLLDRNTAGMILSQQVRMRVVSDGNDRWQGLKKRINWEKGDLLLLIDAHLDAIATTTISPITISPNQWHHIAFQAKKQQTTMIVNDFAEIRPWGTIIGHDLSRFWRPKDFTLGGFGEKVDVPGKVNFFWGSFAGYIDEVRISTVARYDGDEKDFMPRGKFKVDARTVALWHFDEPDGTQKFSDASNNAYHLVGKGGAKIGNLLAIEAHGKLTTTWGRLKK